jgi:prepilin-type N-terminal cleavage/methylation domain-containing protein
MNYPSQSVAPVDASYKKLPVSCGLSKSFTLVELIIVIVIVGILASLGLKQYEQVLEKTRLAEVKMNFGIMRKTATAYYLEKGDFSLLTAADLGIGADFPSSCDTGYYFYYQRSSVTTTSVLLYAHRCTSGGKSPNYTGTQYHPYMYVYSGGTYSVGCQETLGSGNSTPWCAPWKR